MMNHFYKLVRTGFVTLICALQPASLWAEDVFKFFQEEAQVVTASRRPQAIRESPVAIDVITAAEIAASGAIDIWDLLRFRVGMDVGSERSSSTGGRSAVSIRGFPRSTVRDLLVMVDGRSVYSPVRGNVLWEQLPVQIQDIERIEIVRGPNGALYGSNAGLGVINIFTRKAKTKNRVTAEGLGGNRDLIQSAESYEYKGPKAGFRLSHTYRADAGFPRIDDLADFTRYNKANFRGTWSPAENTTYELLAGSTWETNGMGVNDDLRSSQSKYRTTFEMLKWARTLGPDAGVNLQLSRNDETLNIDPYSVQPLDSVTSETGAEASHHFGWMENRMHTTWGLNYEYTRVNSALYFAGQPRQLNRIGRVFGQNAWKITDRFSVIGAASFEHSDTGKDQPAYQVTTLYGLTPYDTLRVSYSRAATIPPLFEKYANFTRHAENVRVGNPGLKPEELSSVEVGYNGSSFQHRLQTEANLFYMTFNDRVTQFDLAEIGDITVESWDNRNGAISRGAEASVKYKLDAQRWVYANYTYESITDNIGDAEMTGFTPHHKVNVGGRTSLGYGFSASINAGYKSVSILGQDDPLPQELRLDARLAYQPIPQLELFVAGQNLTGEQRELEDQLLVPTFYYAGLSFKWGATD